jgi:hypothetical protein
VSACSTPRLNLSSELRRLLEQYPRYVPHRVRTGYNTPTDSHLLDQARFALLSRRAHECFADIILRNSFTIIRRWRLCIPTARSLNSSLVVRSFITTRTIATAYNITTESICPKSMQRAELIPAFGGSFGSDTFLTQFSELRSLQVDNTDHTRFCSNCLLYIRRGNRCFLFWVPCIMGLIDNEANNGSAKEAVWMKVSNRSCPTQCSRDSSPCLLPLLARRKSR